MARPAEFDRNDVLDKAMNVFWRTGYNATSISDLVAATNLKPGSLYGAFKSKHSLYVEVLDTYAARSLSRIVDSLESDENAVECIENFFTRYCNDLQQDEIGRGCLLVNAMLELATEDDFIRYRVADYLDRIELLFVDKLKQAVESGQLDASLDPEDTATYLMSNIWGLRVLSSKRPSADKFQAVIKRMLSALYAPTH